MTKYLNYQQQSRVYSTAVIRSVCLAPTLQSMLTYHRVLRCRGWNTP